MRDNRSITMAEKQARIEIMITVMSLGLSRANILQYIANNTDWGVSDRTIDNYIYEAREIINKMSIISSEYEVGLGLVRLEELYKRALAITDYKIALAVQKERHRFLGLMKNGPLVTINNSNIDQKTNFSHLDDKDLDAELEKYLNIEKE